MQVGQVLLVREDDGLVLSDNLAPEALPARRQLPQLLQFTHSANKTHRSGLVAGSLSWRGPGVRTIQSKVYMKHFNARKGPPSSSLRLSSRE